MRPACDACARAAWAMLAGEALREAPRRDPDDAAKMPVELTLVVEADRLRRLADERPALEQLPRPRDPRVGQVVVGREPDLGAKRADEVELVEPGVRREVIE